MLTLKHEVFSTSIHPKTGQEINTGTLLVGTRIYARNTWKEIKTEDGTFVEVRVKDAASFVGLEKILLHDLENALKP